MALTNTSTAAGGLGRTIGDAVIAFNHVNVMYPICTVQQAARGSSHVNFSDWTKLTSGNVTAATQATTTTAIAITTAARTATITEHVIASTVSDLVLMGSNDDIVGQAGTALGNAVAAKLDDDCVELGKGFSQTECGAGTALALSHIFGAMRQLRAASAPFPYSLVLSPKQVWGPKGIISLLHDDAVTGSNAKPMSLMGDKGNEAFGAGYVTSIAGFNVYWSDQIDEDVSSGGDAAGFAMSKGGIGIGVGPEGLFRIASERDEMLRAVNYVATGFWGEIEVKDGFGVYILTDVS
jgi:hypothetical protein|tara:strand:+ start:1801 stop:2682 length:882 start_codon:yes stop_codon:yes gene_type:complete